MENNIVNRKMKQGILSRRNILQKRYFLKDQGSKEGGKGEVVTV